MDDLVYATLNSGAEFVTYLDMRVPRPVRRLVKPGELVLVFSESRPDGMYDCELSDGAVFRTSCTNLSVLYAGVGKEVSFMTPAVQHSTHIEPAMLRSGTIIAVCTGRQFGHVLVQGNTDAYLVPVQDIAH